MAKKLSIYYLTISVIGCLGGCRNEAPVTNTRSFTSASRAKARIMYYSDHHSGLNEGPIRFDLYQKDEYFVYSLIWRENGKVICRDIPYVKTFGGKEFSIEVQLIEERLIAYPVTIKGSKRSVTGQIEPEWQGFTAVFDLKSGKTVFKSESYWYINDVPLKLPPDISILSVE